MNSYNDENNINNVKLDKLNLILNKLSELDNKFDKGVPGEGMVVKTNYGKERPRHSFNVISNKYLLKNG